MKGFSVGRRDKKTVYYGVDFNFFLPKIEVGRKVIIQKPPYTRIWKQMKNLIPE